MKNSVIRSLFVVAVSCLGVLSCSTPSVTVTVYNPIAKPRPAEIVEIDAPSVTGRVGDDFVVTDEAGRPMVAQLTYDNKILFSDDFGPLETRKFLIHRPKPSDRQAGDTVCVGMIRHDKQDDFAWENDRGGYRLYGPSYRREGGNVSGYDIWTKSVDYPVLAARYDDHEFCNASYHKDHGSGMDVYTVGRTLGAGMNALVADGVTAYPCAYRECDILESGPLRMTARITCYPELIETDSCVVETRTISLDRGSWLNKTEVSYEGLSRRHRLINGIVVHRQNTRGYVHDPEGRYLAYADLTDNTDRGNGIIFIGVVNPSRPDSVGYSPLEAPLGDAVGHVLTHTTYNPGDTYTYYWGAGWSKGGVRGMRAWCDYLADFHERLGHPLEVTVK